MNAARLVWAGSITRRGRAAWWRRLLRQLRRRRLTRLAALPTHAYLPGAAGRAHHPPGALSLQADAELNREPYPSEGQEKVDLHPLSPWEAAGVNSPAA